MQLPTELIEAIVTFAEQSTGQETIDLDEFLAAHDRFDRSTVQDVLQGDCALQALDGSGLVFDRYEILALRSLDAHESKDQRPSRAPVVLSIGNQSLVQFDCGGCSRAIWRPSSGPFRCGHCGFGNPRPTPAERIAWDDDDHCWVRTREVHDVQ